MSRVAWSFYDFLLGQTYIFEQNPNQMTSPQVKRAFDSSGSIGGVMLVTSQRQTVTWEFSGTLRTQNQHNTFALWVQKKYPFVITDHFGIKRMCKGVTFEAEDQRDGRNPWLHHYTFKVSILDADSLSPDLKAYLA